MIQIWWPAFLVPVLMTIGGFLPFVHYRSPGGALDGERQAFADRQMHHMLRQCGLAFAALAFMVMRSVCLLPEEVQRWLLYAAVAVEVLGALLMAMPIERALKMQFEEDTQQDEGDHT